MVNICDTSRLTFHALTVEDRKTLQEVTLRSGRRNCNFTFANLIGWQFWFNTELCIWGDMAVFRFNMEGRRAYMVCAAGVPSMQLLELMCEDAATVGSHLLLMCLENEVAAKVEEMMPGRVSVKPRRNQYDYIYLRKELVELKGKDFKAKRNHVNKFLSEHADFRYCDLEPSLLGECREVVRRWRDEVDSENHEYNIMANAEQQAMETVFGHWDELGVRGGCIYVGEKMVAFTYGSAVTYDTFDVCVEKADRTVDGAFNIINQQFAAHLPEQYVYLNREEDMGLEGLRKSKLSYRPQFLLSYNNVIIRCQ